MDTSGFNQSWWMAILLAIPLAVVANLVTAWLQKSAENKGSRRIANRRKALTRDIAIAERAMARFDSPLEYLVYVGLQATALSAVFGAMAAIIGSVMPVLRGLNTPDFAYFPDEVFYSFGSLVGAQGAVIVAMLILYAVRTHRLMKMLPRMREDLATLPT